MAEEGKKSIGAATAFIIGLLLGAGVVLVFHAKQSALWLDQLSKANQMAEDNRILALMNKSARLELEKKASEGEKPSAETPKPQ